MSFDKKAASIDLLDLSRRPYNCLRQAGIDTVGQLAALSDEELLAIHELGMQSFAEIKRKMQVYLARHPFRARDSYRTDAPVSLSSRQVTSVSTPRPRADRTALEALGLSVRSYNSLTRSGIKSVEQLTAMSDKQIAAVRNIGTKSLAEIENKLEAYLTKHPLPAEATRGVQAPEPPPPRMVNPQVLELAEEGNIPLNNIPIQRLSLSESVESLLLRARVGTIGALTREPWDKWQSNPIVKQRLEEYLDWLIQQGEHAWANEKADHGLNPLLRLELRETTLEVLMTSWLSVLSDRDRRVTRWHHGLDGTPLTLEEIGERVGGVTRERVRQIQARAERRLGHPLHRRKVYLLRVLLIHLLEEAGGVMSEAHIEAALRRNTLVGDVDLIGASRLVFDFHSDFDRVGARIWGLTCYPLAEVKAVQEQITRVLQKAHAPMPTNEVIGRLKETRFYHHRQDRLPEAFVIACLRAHPGCVYGDDHSYGLKRWERSRIDEIVQALREIGEPAHYTVIAEKANAILEPEMQTSARNIHEILCRRRDLFVWIRVRGTFGLKEWGLEKPPSYKEALARILESAKQPLTLEEILARFPDVRPYYKENSVSMTLMMNEHFQAFSDGTYGLSSWRLADEHIDGTPALQRELKRKVAKLLGISWPREEAE